MKINSPLLLGALRALGIAVLGTVVHFLGDATNLTFISSPLTITIITMIALAIEHQLGEKSGSALFGAVKTR